MGFLLSNNLVKMSKKNKAQADSQAAKTVPLIFDSTLLWKYLKKKDVEQLENLIPFEIEKYIAELFNLNSYEIDLKEACYLDFYVTQYYWTTRQKKFNHELTSAFFTVAYELMNNLREKNLSLADIVHIYEKLLLEANDCNVFPDDVLKNVITHLERTFFQQYKLYKYVINETQSEILIPKEIMIECPKPVEQHYPAPLDEAMSEQTYNKYVLKIDDDEEKIGHKSGTVIEEDENQDFEIKQELIDQISEKFSGLSIEDARKIIFEVTNEMVTDLKSDMKNKIKERESSLLNELEKSGAKKSKK